MSRIPQKNVKRIQSNEKSIHKRHSQKAVSLDVLPTSTSSNKGMLITNSYILNIYFLQLYLL